MGWLTDRRIKELRSAMDSQDAEIAKIRGLLHQTRGDLGRLKKKFDALHDAITDIPPEPDADDDQDDDQDDAPADYAAALRVR